MIKAPTTAYLLVIHGSRDPRPQIAVNKLVELVSQELETTSHQRGFDQAFGAPQATAVISPSLVGAAALELASLPLYQSIVQFAQLQKGVKRIQILPLFLLPGVHVTEDIPAEVATAQQQLGEIQIGIRPYLGSQTGIIDILAEQFEQLPAQARVLLSHGSRRPRSNQPVEAIAAQLNAVAAYWSTSPSLEQQVENLTAAGYRDIAVVPYFLFAGGITEAITLAVQQLQQFEINLYLGEPLGATPQLASLIVEEIKR